MSPCTRLLVGADCHSNRTVGCGGAAGLAGLALECEWLLSLEFNDNIVHRNKGSLSQTLDLEGPATLQLAKPEAKQMEGLTLKI